MILGYSIGPLADPSKKDEFARFLKDNCIFEEGVADNLAQLLATGHGANIYSQSLTADSFRIHPGYDFSVNGEIYPIETIEGLFLVISAVDFKLEFVIDGRVRILHPMDYFNTTREVALSLQLAVSQGLIKIYPDPNLESQNWILATTRWNDDGVWIDEDAWKD